MTRILALLVLVAAIVAAPAAAKGVTGLRVCGSDGCADVDVPTAVHEFPGAAGQSSAPPPAGPFVEVEAEFDGGFVERLWYVPGAHAFALRAEAHAVHWSEESPQRIDGLIAAAAERVRPYRPRAVAVLVGDERVVGDVSGYLALFGADSTGPARAGADGFVPISVKTDPPSPWALTGLSFSPDQGLLQRGSELIRLDAGVAADVRRARPLATRGETQGFDWPLVSGSLLTAVAFALCAALFARRGRHAGPAEA